MMKSQKFTNRKRVPVAIILLFLVIVVIIAFLLGFRITYAPELENNWNAISAVAAWVSACATIGAVWAAIQIPNKIAERQDKIALINSRLEIADKIEDISSKVNVSYDIVNRLCKSEYTADSMLMFFSYAMGDEFQKNSSIIRKYDLYFSEYNTCMIDWRLLYMYINISCIELDKVRDRNNEDNNILIKELIESITEASEFVNSEQFKQWKVYMHETISITK